MAHDKQVARSLTMWAGFVSGVISSDKPQIRTTLSAILERNVLDPKYYLSPVACAGILRRAEARGKTLPEQLHRALTDGANRTRAILIPSSNPALPEMIEDGSAVTLEEAQAETQAYRMVAFGEYADDNTASAMKARDYKDATDLVTAPASYAVRTAQTGSNGWGITEELSYTLDAASPQAVCVRQDGCETESDQRGADAHRENECVIAVDTRNGTLTNGVTHTLQAKPNGGMSPNCTPHLLVPQPSGVTGDAVAAEFRAHDENYVAYQSTGIATYDEGIGTLRANGGDVGGGSESLIVGVDNRQGTLTGEIAHTMCAKPNGGYSQNSTPHVLTPLPTIAVRTNQTGAGGPIWSEDVTDTLAADHPPAVCVTGDVTHSLTYEGHDASEDGTGRGTPIVVVKGAAIGRKPEAGPQYGEVLEDGTVYTLNCTEVHAVTVPHPVRIVEKSDPKRGVLAGQLALFDDDEDAA